MKSTTSTHQPFQKKRLLGVTSLMIVLVGGGIWGFNATLRTHQASSQTNTEQTETAEVAVNTAKVGHQTMRRDRVVTGTVSSQKSATLTTRVNGTIEEILVDEGDRVTKGDLIAKIDVRDIQAQANQAQANLSQAQAAVNSARSAYISAQSQKNEAEARVQQAKGELQEEKAELEDAKLHQRRMEMLYENGAVSKSRLDEANARLASSKARMEQIQANIQQARSAVQRARSQMEQAQSNIKQARAGVDQAQANLEQSTANLDYGKVKAPFNGVITKKQAHEGAMAGAMAGFGQPIVTVETVENLEFKVSVPESLLGTIAVGERMPVQIDALGRNVSGKVTQIVPSADPKSRNFTVKMALDQDKQVIPGMFGRLTLSTKEKAGLMIPESAVIERFGITGVYRVVDNKAQFTTVTPGSQKGEQVQIHSGLEVGDTIILNPSKQVKDGVKVAIK
jgi:multidrug efflux pump subunit AcrA (membrane-fusion protein)